MSSRYLIPLAVAAALAAPVAAHAQEGTYDPGKWLVRVGMSQLNPDSYNLDLGNGTAVVADSDLSPTATVEYMITPNLGTELLVAWPFTHGLDLDSGGRPLDRVAHVDVLPPTLSLNWHFNPNGMFRPYIGAGVNYTLFSGEETRGALSGNNLKLDDGIGAAGQVGVDIGERNWFVNVNVRYIDLSSDVSLNGVDVGTADLNPWVYGLHVGYRFGHMIPPAPVAAPVVAPPPPPPPRPPSARTRTTTASATKPTSARALRQAPRSTRSAARSSRPSSSCSTSTAPSCAPSRSRNSSAS